MAAARAGDGATLVELLSSADPSAATQANGQGDSALHWTAFKGLLPACELLLERGAGVDARGDCGNTPLGLAAAGPLFSCYLFPA